MKQYGFDNSKLQFGLISYQINTPVTLIDRSPFSGGSVIHSA